VSEQFTLQVRLGSKELEQQVKKLEQAFKPGGATGGSAGIKPQVDQMKKLNLFTEKIQKNIAEQVPTGENTTKQLRGMSGSLLKLVGIGVGLGALTALMTKSSGILQGTFKLFQTTALLMIKPIADMMGLLFRPLALLVITNIALPWLKYAKPWYEKVNAVGEAFAAFYEDPKGALENLGVSLQDPNQLTLSDAIFSPIIKFDAEKLEKVADEVLDFLGFESFGDEVEIAKNNLIAFGKLVLTPLPGLEKITTFFTDVNDKVTAVLQPAWTTLSLFFGDLFNFLTGGDTLEAIQTAFGFFKGVMEKIGEGSKTIQVAWFTFKKFWLDVGDTIASSVGAAWETIKATMEGIKVTILEIFDGPITVITDTFESIKTAIDETLEGPITTITDTFKDIAKKIEEVATVISGAISFVQSLLSKLGGGGGGRERRGQTGLTIREPIVGIGQKTGTSFLFGESGIEDVVPRSGGGKTKPSIALNITITGNTISSDLDLQEITSKVNNQITNKLTELGIL